MQTIFPGIKDDTTPKSKPGQPELRDMFEAGRPGGWLDFLDDTNPQRFTYFENMSEAMANLCSGHVFVMTPNPGEIHLYGSKTPKNDNNDHSIWNNVERPALRRGGQVTAVYAIDATNPRMGRKVNLETGEPEDGNMNFFFINPPTLQKRDQKCVPNFLYEPPGEDWFGTGSVL